MAVSAKVAGTMTLLVRIRDTAFPPANFADGERLFRSIVIGRLGDRERSGAILVSLLP
jgi:hypothetical protein